MINTSGNQEPSYGYWAFISYSHADEAYASQVHRALESYKLPKRLRGQETKAGIIPDRLFPMFRDVDELPGSSDLGDELRQALLESRNLVVICSPAAAQSKWVNEEIREFQSLSRGNGIFCLISKGDPKATDSESRIFPAAISGEPLAVDFRGGSAAKRDAILRLIAGMLGLGFDDLKRRDRQRRVRNAAIATVASIALLIGVAALWSFGQDQQEVAESRTLAADSIRATDEDESPVAGLELAIQAFEVSRTVEARKALELAIEYQHSLLILEFDADVRHASFSADGDRILTCSAEPAVRTWSAETGEVLQDIAVQGPDVWGCSFSPDSSEIVAVVGGNAIHLWDAETGERKLELTGHADKVRQVQFSGDGSRLIAAYSDGEARVWDIQSGLLNMSVSASEYELRAAFLIAEDSVILAVAENGVVTTWDVASRTMIQEFGELMAGVHTAKISPDERQLIITNYQARPYMWELSNPARLMNSPTPIIHVSGAAFSADSSSLVLGGGDGFATVINVVDEHEIKRLQHPGLVNSMAFAGNGEMIITAADKIRIWSMPVLGGGVARSSTQIRGHVGGISFADLAPDNEYQILTVGEEDYSVRLWDISEFGMLINTPKPAELGDVELLELARKKIPPIGYANSEGD